MESQKIFWELIRLLFPNFGLFSHFDKKLPQFLIFFIKKYKRITRLRHHKILNMKLGSASRQNLDLINSNFEACGQFVSRINHV